MAPKTARAQQQQRNQLSQAGSPKSSNSNYLTSTYRELTSPENASAVRSVVMFGVAVTFLSSSFSELLLPGY